MYVTHECMTENAKEGTGEDNLTTMCLYVRYNHAPQVDLKQMQNDLDKVLKLLHKSRLVQSTPSGK
jgi:hypothetical protein